MGAHMPDQRNTARWMAAAGAVAGALGALLFAPTAGAARTAGGDGPAEVAARAFLDSLPADLRRKATFDFSSEARFAWHFIPRQRDGVSLLDLDDAQSEALGPLLGTALSPEGLLVARGVIKHENILRRVETEAGVDATRRDPGRYHTMVFGRPDGAAPWGWRFEGHHLSMNVTQLPGQPPVVAPFFVGANPAKVASGPNAGFRLLAAEEDLGRELIRMLSEDARRTALIRDDAFSDIVTGNERRVGKLELAGLAAHAMSAPQQAQLRRLIDLYLDRLNLDAALEAKRRMDRRGFDEVHFAWAGGIEPGEPHYYRIHGPTLLIEYDDTQNGANHIHTVYRDLDRDFGGDPLRAHYRHDHRSEPYLASR